MGASDGDRDVFSVVCTDSWPSEAMFEVGIVLASGSWEGSSPCLADRTRVIGRGSVAVVWSGFSFIEPRDIDPLAPRLAPEEDPACVGGQGSSAFCWWPAMPVSCSCGDDRSSICSWRAVLLRFLVLVVGGACPAEVDSDGEGLSCSVGTFSGCPS